VVPATLHRHETALRVGHQSTKNIPFPNKLGLHGSDLNEFVHQVVVKTQQYLFRVVEVDVESGAPLVSYVDQDSVWHDHELQSANIYFELQATNIM
jgi:hypothetical protein